MAYVRSGNSGGGGGTLQETTLANFTVSANSSVTKNIGVSGAKVVMVYAVATFTNTYITIGIPTKNKMQVGNTSGWSDSGTLSISFSGDSFTISSTSSYNAAFKSVNVMYEV